MAANNVSENRNIQIAKIATNKAILDIQDALEIGKIQVILVDYQDRANTKTLKHYMNIPAAKVLMKEVLRGTFKRTYGNKFAEYKGSRKTDGQVEARQLTVTYTEGKNYPYTIGIARGEGQKTETGAVTMKKVTDKAYIVASEVSLKEMAVTVLDYVRAYEITQMAARLLLANRSN